MPCTEFREICVFFSGHLHALPLPNNFFPACLGCQNKAVGGFMCLEIFQKSIWTASGEPLARSFDKKMVLAPKPTIPFLTTIFEGPFWSVFGGGGAVKINKNRPK